MSAARGMISSIAGPVDGSVPSSSDSLPASLPETSSPLAERSFEATSGEDRGVSPASESKVPGRGDGPETFEGLLGDGLAAGVGVGSFTTGVLAGAASSGWLLAS
jgi:hypothetical protein